MRCEVVMGYLDAFRTGELTERQGLAMTRHLASCLSCTQELDRVRGLAVQAKRVDVGTPRRILTHVLEKTADRYAEVPTEIGTLLVGFNARGITMISPGEDARAFERNYMRRFGRVARAGEVPGQYARMVQQAVAGNAVSTVPVDLAGLPKFEREVLSLLRRIPRGEVRPYFWLASQAGRPKAARAVGTAMARNPVPFLLPCHRVVPAAGGVGNYAFGSEVKRELLRREGAPLEELARLAAMGARYIGCRTTNIYCFPTCRHARRIRPENRIALTNVKEAEAAGYRPCLRCKPPAPG